jgi:hypothetical protein
VIVDPEFTAAVDHMANVFADPWTAGAVGGRMTCSEADALADVLYLSGHEQKAHAFLVGHANGWPDVDGSGDTDPEDLHYYLRETEPMEAKA